MGAGPVLEGPQEEFVLDLGETPVPVAGGIELVEDRSEGQHRLHRQVGISRLRTEGAQVAGDDDGVGGGLLGRDFARDKHATAQGPSASSLW